MTAVTNDALAGAAAITPARDRQSVDTEAMETKPTNLVHIDAIIASLTLAFMPPPQTRAESPRNDRTDRHLVRQLPLCRS
jgi:hypothetical protein